MSTKPAPYPADTRAKGWRFELDYEQIEQSDTWGLASEVPMCQHALLMMWMMAWQQVPCGSLPADESVIRAKCRVPAAVWSKCRDVMMRGWWLADDGRLYHDTLAARVLEMMGRRRSDSDRQARKRAGQQSESRGGHADVTRDTDVTPTGVHPESSTEYRQRTKEVSDGAKAPSSSAKPTGKPARHPEIPPPFDAIVEAYHAALPDLPKVVLRSGKTWDKRRKAMAERWRWVLTSTRSDGQRRATTGDEAMAWIREFFARATHNDWLMGRTQPSKGHEGWRCDFDFLLSDAGLKAVVERTEVAA